MAMAEVVSMSVGAAYDLWSASYDAQDNPMVVAAGRILGQVTGPVDGRRVVEFGCGTGRNLAALRAAGATGLTGVDLSAGMLAKARERDGGFRLIEAAIGAPLPLAPGETDLVLCSLVLEHLSDLAPAFAEAARLLTLHGRLAVIEIHPFLAYGGTAAHFHDSSREVRMPTFAHRFSDYVAAGIRSGLVLADCREWTPAGLGEGLSARVWKRGPDHPLAISMVFRRSGR
jgi:malonyl-CoA O-methyltransferase